MVPTGVAWTKHDSIYIMETVKWKYAIIAAILANKKIHLIGLLNVRDCLPNNPQGLFTQLFFSIVKIVVKC